jgi:hypothetical protein
MECEGAAEVTQGALRRGVETLDVAVGVGEQIQDVLPPMVVGDGTAGRREEPLRVLNLMHLEWADRDVHQLPAWGYPGEKYLRSRSHD